MRPRTRRRLMFVGGFVVYFSILWTFWYTPLVYPPQDLRRPPARAVPRPRYLGDRRLGRPHRAGPPPGRCDLGDRRQRVRGPLGRIPGKPPVGHRTRGSRPLEEAARRKGHRGSGNASARAHRSLCPQLFRHCVRALFGLALLVCARYLSGLWNRRLVLVLGMTSCLYAVLDIKSDVLDRPNLPSDAAMLAEATGSLRSSGARSGSEWLSWCAPGCSVGPGGRRERYP